MFYSNFRFDNSFHDWKLGGAPHPLVMHANERFLEECNIIILLKEYIFHEMLAALGKVSLPLGGTMRVRYEGVRRRRTAEVYRNGKSRVEIAIRIVGSREEDRTVSR